MPLVIWLLGLVGHWFWLPWLSLPLGVWLVRFIGRTDGRPLEPGPQADRPVAPGVRAAVRGRLGSPNVPDWLRQRAQLSPAAVALIGAERLDLRRPRRARRRRYGGLRARGIQPGQRVGLRAPNGVGFVVAVHALMRIGAVLVPINTRLTAPEVAWQRADADRQLGSRRHGDLAAPASL